MTQHTTQISLFPTEEWRDIPGYEGIYQISDRGHVRSRRRRGGKLDETWRDMKGQRDADGYGYVRLRLNNSFESPKIHRLVLLTFVGNPPPYTQASHLDGNKANNCLGNLAWETASQNSLRKNDHGTMAHTRAKLTEVQVCEIRSLWPGKGMTQRAISRLYGVGIDAIQAILARETWKHI